MSYRLCQGIVLESAVQFEAMLGDSKWGTLSFRDWSIIKFLGVQKSLVCIYIAVVGENNLG